MHTVHRLAPVVAFWLLVSTGSAAAVESRVWRLADGTEVTIAVEHARGEHLLLWLPAGFGRQPGEEAIAAAAAARGLEVWRPELLEARFLDPLESSLEQVAASDVAELIEHAHRASGKRVLLLASARAGVLALRGAQAWHVRHPSGRALAGAILLHPNLFLGPPEPGRDAAYDPVVARTRVPVFVLQPELSPWHWRLLATRAELGKAGALVYTRQLPGLRDRFYFRVDATPEEELARAQLPALLQSAAGMLARTAVAAPPARPLAAEPAAIQRASASRALQVWRGEPQPPPLRLATLDGRRLDLADYRGRVVLVNFWASWCPPCVHEMPSMQRLQDKLTGRPFSILAVNMFESPDIVRQFLDTRVRVDFPILMDRDGAALKRWKVFAFPTTYIVGPEGRIRYALYGGLEWDSTEALEVIEKLLREGR